MLFCRSDAGDDSVNKLWVLDLDEAQPVERLLVDPKVVLAQCPSGIELSEAEKARRERLREAGGGIVTYDVHFATRQVAFVLGSSLYVCNIDSGDVRALVGTDGAFDPRFSADGKTVAYCADRHVYVYELVSDVATAVTNSSVVCESVGCLETDQSWGLAEFVAAEEMRRSRGHWFSPDSGAVAVCHVDDVDVKKWWISEPVEPAKGPRPIAYPAAGTTNSSVRLFVIGSDGSSCVEVRWDRTTFEYLCRVVWNSRGLYLLVQTRDQKVTRLIKADPVSGETELVFEHCDDAWVELISGCPAITDVGVFDIRDDVDCDTRRVFRDGVAFSPAGLQVRSLVCADGGGVIVQTSPTPTTLVASHIDFDGNVSHFGQMSAVETLQANRSFKPDSQATSNSTSGAASADMATGAVAVLRSSDMDSADTVTRIIRPGFEPYTLQSFAFGPNLDFNVQLSTVGTRQLHCALVLPSDRSLLGSGPLPVLMDPYGGPHAQRVLRRCSAYSASQFFADQGFAVVICDGAGTPARGPVFEREVLGDLAGPVLDDQIAALYGLADANPGVLDLSRVGIKGWSFGGYLAALAVMKRPDIFHAGIAGAPVSDWLLYDTHYTERYLGHPDTDAQAYVRSDLTPLAKDLSRPLLLIHGFADDNVVAAHTYALSRALLEAGRAHQVLPLSGVSHMTPQAEVAENLLLLQVEFLKKELDIS